MGESGGIVRFLTVRAVALGLVFFVTALISDDLGPSAAAGVLLGAFFSAYKVRIYVRVLHKQTAGTHPVQLVLYPAVSVFLPLLLLTLAALRSTGLFIGMAAGLLLMPFIIFVNAFTESLGITHNQWKG